MTAKSSKNYGCDAAETRPLGRVQPRKREKAPSLRVGFPQRSCVRNDSIRDASIDFAPIAHFQINLAFLMGVIQMRYRFRDGEKAMDIVGIGKKTARDFPG